MCEPMSSGVVVYCFPVCPRMSTHWPPLQRRHLYLNVVFEVLSLFGVLDVPHLPFAITKIAPQGGVGAWLGIAGAMLGWLAIVVDGCGFVPGTAVTPAVVMFDCTVTGSWLTMFRPFTSTR